MALMSRDYPSQGQEKVVALNYDFSIIAASLGVVNYFGNRHFSINIGDGFGYTSIGAFCMQ